ncbi:GNAT family N-acetyltransferase [Shinella sp.]|uniref:GNAT family N-acetyltransferase n=1 Tax=Shinella sp. TaxID=1870904 RepID=UPI0029B8A961|nr:GNAT family N-acetyltransferase [Shinella sp.]MDX3977959.1 GNAT family N-acetyltransferase [Shinella sp.]
MDLLVTYMELCTPPLDRPALPAPSTDLEIRAERLSLGDYLSLYQAVGEPLTWDQRLRMPQDALAQLLSAPSTIIFVLREAGQPVGLCEFDAANEQDIELVHFGLVPAAYGRRLGPFLLDTALRAAWQTATRRIWLHTDTNDHAKAQATYARAGFTPYLQRMETFAD